MKINFKRYALYLLRWQLSTPILAGCVVYFNRYGDLWATVIGNFFGGLTFFWIDRFIFQSESLDASWQVREKVMCSDCGKIARGYRLVKSKNYDKRHDEHPKFRCESCSEKKAQSLKEQGYILEESLC